MIYLALLVIVLVGVVQLRAFQREHLAEAENPARGQFVTVDGVRIHAQVMGSGPDLVLLHGASGNTHDFTFDLAERLKGSYRLFILDRPGLGWSERPAGFDKAWSARGESPREQARLLKAAAEQLGAKRPLVLGHSFGGAVALAWALEFEAETAGLVLLSAVSNPWPGGLHWTYPVNGSALGGALFVPMLTAFVPNAYVDRTVASIFAPQIAPANYAPFVGSGLTLRRKTLRANARQVNGLRPHIVEMSQDYPRLTLPIEVLHGDADTIVPLAIHSEPLAQTVASANLVVMNGIGHMPHHADPKAAIAAIARAAHRAGLR